MNARSARALIRYILVATMGIGCNAILDNTPGELRQSTHGQTPETLGECGAGRRVCDGKCVSTDDPAYGCGDPSCSACPGERGTPACRDGACAVTPRTCDPGFADCNEKLSDGCETDLSRVKSCGACGVECGGTTPLCAPTESGFACSSGCRADAPERCGDECVSTQTSPNHCGACNAACPAVNFGTSECKAGRCGFTCKQGYHACSSKCMAATDPAACGPTCAVCPIPANGTATCAADKCGLSCNTGFGDCNKNANDGCEAAFATDKSNCGGCGKVCDGTCESGVCKAAP